MHYVMQSTMSSTCSSMHHVMHGVMQGVMHDAMHDVYAEHSAQHLQHAVRACRPCVQVQAATARGWRRQSQWKRCVVLQS